MTENLSQLNALALIDFMINTAPQGSNLPPSCHDETAQLPLDLPIS